MRMRLPIITALIIFALTTIACSFASGATPTPQPAATSAPTATQPPIAPTAAPNNPATAAPPLISVSPPAGTPPISSTITVTTTAAPTNTVTATTAPATQAPPPSTGPLDFNVSIVGCQLDPSRQGGVILTIRIDATGGNGIYLYYRENIEVTQVSERPATKGTAVIDAYRVTSSDGQTIQKKIRFTGSEFGCR